MIESRCGILCAGCSYREEMNCGGCTNISKPFWGDSCPIKYCCEKKLLKHCGQCTMFPCDKLNEFAYDKEQGDDGKRLDTCRMWQASKTWPISE